MVFWRRKKRAPVQISREDLLKLVPLKNPVLKWEKNSGEVSVFVPMGEFKHTTRLARRVGSQPPRRIVLDRLSTDVWELCDGINTIDDIVLRFCATHRVQRHQAEPAIIALLGRLTGKGLVAMTPRQVPPGKQSSRTPGEELSE